MKKYVSLAAVLLLLLTTLSPVPTARAGGLITLGTAANFGVVGASTVTNTGFTVVNGDLGLHPGSSVTGFPPGVVNGTIHIADAVALQAKLDATVAYVAAAALPCPGANNLTGQDLGGLTLVPGVYCFASSAFLTGILTLDGPGQYVFQIGSTLITASSSSVNLINGADPCEIFWQVGSSATLGTFTNFAGNIIALASVGLNTNANNRGGLYALTAAVTLDDNDITACDAGPTPTATTAPADTATNTPTNTATNTPINTPANTATNTPQNTATNTATRTPTALATTTRTRTPVPATSTPTTLATGTRTGTNTRTATGVPSATSTNTAQPGTNTSTPTKTRRPTKTPTVTRTVRPATKTNTPIGTKTRVPTNTKTPTKTRTPYYATKTPTSGYATKTKTRTPTRTRTAIYQATPTKSPTPNCISPNGTRWDCPTETPVVPCATVYNSTNVPVAICDECTVYSNLSVPAGGTIASVEVVNLRVSQTYPADLDVFLIAPNGTRVELFTDKCGGNPDWTQSNTGFQLAQDAPQGIGASCPPGTGTYKPEGNLSLLSGQPRGGTWRIEVHDDGAIDVGTLYSWGLRIVTACGAAEVVAPAVPVEPEQAPAYQYGLVYGYAYLCVMAYIFAVAGTYVYTMGV